MTSLPPVNTPQKNKRRASPGTRAKRLSDAETPEKIENSTPRRRGRPPGAKNKKGSK